MEAFPQYKGPVPGPVQSTESQKLLRKRMTRELLGEDPAPPTDKMNLPQPSGAMGAIAASRSRINSSAPLNTDPANVATAAASVPNRVGFLQMPAPRAEIPKVLPTQDPKVSALFSKPLPPKAPEAPMEGYSGILPAATGKAKIAQEVRRDRVNQGRMNAAQAVMQRRAEQAQWNQYVNDPITRAAQALAMQGNAGGVMALTQGRVGMANADNNLTLGLGQNRNQADDIANRLTLGQGQLQNQGLDIANRFNLGQEQNRNTATDIANRFTINQGALGETREQNAFDRQMRTDEFGLKKPNIELDTELKQAQIEQAKRRALGMGPTDQEFYDANVAELGHYAAMEATKERAKTRSLFSGGSLPPEATTAPKGPVGIAEGRNRLSSMMEKGSPYRNLAESLGVIDPGQETGDIDGRDFADALMRAKDRLTERDWQLASELHDALQSNPDYGYGSRLQDYAGAMIPGGGNMVQPSKSIWDSLSSRRPRQ